MILDDVRPSFSVYVVATDALEFATNALDQAGYLVSSFLDLDLAFAAVPTNPPHVIVLEQTLGPEEARVAVERILAHLPETHVILMAPVDDRAAFAPLLDGTVYDILLTPISAAIEVRRAVDRAVERDYFMYQGERQVSEPRGHVTPPEVVTPDDQFPVELFAKANVDECIVYFLGRLKNGGVFFRYLANRRTLIAAIAAGVSGDVINRTGLDLNADVEGFSNDLLKDPARVPKLTALVTETLGADNFVLRPLVLANEVVGVLAWRESTEPSDAVDARFQLLERAASFKDTERRFHVVNTRDLGTEVLARPNFLERVTQEVSRARRVNLPVALLAMAFDQFDLIGADIGASEAQTMLRAIAKLCERFSRVNDVIGRLGPSELGLLLPHTSRRGALIKAERLRRALAQADFGKVVRTHARVTVSIGVSEYPTLVRDAEELVATADETLFHVRKFGNRTAVSEVPNHFAPDFVVRDLA